MILRALRLAPACLGLVLSAALLLPPAVAAAGPVDSAAWRHSGACLVVDTDVALDDLRAFAVLLPQRTPDVVVVTEGISTVARGTTAIGMYLGAAERAIPVIQGDTATAPPNYDWLPPVRANAERLNGFLAAAVPAMPAPIDVADAVQDATRGCAAVDVLALGPWTSFVHYAPRLDGRLKQVIASGRPLPETNPDNFNCEYDRASCAVADALLRRAHHAVWVDLPTDTSPRPSYAPTPAMVNAFGVAGLPGVLRTALNLDPSPWLTTRLWDDSAALYLLHPDGFTPHGAHLEPAVDEATLRNREVQAVNSPEKPWRPWHDADVAQLLD